MDWLSHSNPSFQIPYKDTKFFIKIQEKSNKNSRKAQKNIEKLRNICYFNIISSLCHYFLTFVSCYNIATYWRKVRK